MIATQVTHAVQIPVTAQLVATAQAAGTTTHTVTLKTNSAQPLVLVSTKPSFDEAVVKPLKAKQEAEAKALEAKKAAVRITTAVKRTPVIIGGDDAFAKLRFCEAGGDYTKNTGNGFYGAYQYNLGTWANYGGYTRP
ncbi:transglycosylase family protein, partial [Candidatus Saccharibacteria bacterium]|nr:transglycosylase family protein [Candidatus Saccharibacteria bacterium]